MFPACRTAVEASSPAPAPPVVRPPDPADAGGNPEPPASAGSVSQSVAVVEVDELDALMERAGRLGFMWHLFREDRNGPEVLAGVFDWGGCADVFVLADEQRAHAYRVPTGAPSEVFSPREVLWWYRHSPVWTLRALLTLPRPDHPDAPTRLMLAPPGAGIPGDRMPVRLRTRGPRR